jgi:nucleotide-binding universal stress UspA family protein
MLPVKNIIAPTDFSQPSYEALAAASELALHFGAELCVIHVVPALPALPPDPNFVFKVPEYEQALHADAVANLRKLAEGTVKKGIRTRTMVGHGDAGSEIVRIAQSEGADLIVLATHGTTGWRHLVFGSVAERVVRLAHCPVLSIRASRA